MSLVNLAHMCSHLQNSSRARLALTSVPLTKLHLAFALGLHREGFLSSVNIGGPQPPLSQIVGYEEADTVVGVNEIGEDVVADEAEEESWVRRGFGGEVEDVSRQWQRPGVLDEVVKEGERGHGELGGTVDVDGSNVVRIPDASSSPSPSSSSLAAASSTEDTAPTNDNDTHLRSILGPALSAFLTPLPPHQRPSPSPSTLNKHFANTSTPLHRRPLSKHALAALDVPSNPARRRLWLGLKYHENKPVLSSARLVSKPTKRISLDARELGRVVRGWRQGQVPGLTRPGECLFVLTSKGLVESREAVRRKLGGMAYARVL